MATLITPIRRSIRRRGPIAHDAPETGRPSVPPQPAQPSFEISPNDPLLAYLEDAGEPVDIETLELESPALSALKAAGITLAVPLIAQGELVGVLNLGPRLSEQDYSSDDRRLLYNLAARAAPALRVGQLVREQQAEAATRQRFEQELEVARLIQQNFLPKELPEIPGWELGAYYRPAREVGGDFYDVIPLHDGRIGFVVGDVTDKGVPAALVMSATRSVLRASAQRLIEPGAVLERVNEHLCPDMPAKMFVTCLYAVLEPESGRLRFANAGHELPYVKSSSGVGELRARGMPLGLMPGMSYEENEAVLEPGETVLLHSDGVVEAHDPKREMFGFPRLKDTVAGATGGRALIDCVLGALASFTGPGSEQEDDVTMVTLHRSSPRRPSSHGRDVVLVEFELASEPGNERRAIARLEEAVSGMQLDTALVDRMKTALGEATMNAMEHGNGYRAQQPVTIRVLCSPFALRVQVTDLGGAQELRTAETPDLDAKLAGQQTPRGWGLFLIQNMVDEANVISEAERRTLELVLYLKGAGDGLKGAGDGDS